MTLHKIALTLAAAAALCMPAACGPAPLEADQIVPSDNAGFVEGAIVGAAVGSAMNSSTATRYYRPSYSSVRSSYSSFRR